MTKDYYDTLGVEKSATKEEIKKAYKKLAKKYHPDINKEDNAQDTFKEINEAAAVLGDDEKRQQYDQFGDADAFKQASGYGGFNNSDFSDFASFDFGDIFDQFFGGGGRRRGRQQARGSDLRFDMEISLEEAAFGVEKEVTIPRNVSCSDCSGSGAKDEDSLETCPDCNGQGRVTRSQRTPFGLFQTQGACPKCKGEGKWIKEECVHCDGTGLVHDSSKITVKVPPGAEEGTNLRVSGAGEGAKGGSSGDLYIVLHQKDHETFERQGDNIYLKMAISFSLAALGGEISVPTLDGKAKLKIPAGTQTNTIFRMNDHGIPFLHGSGKGDELVEVVVDVPEKLSKKQKKLITDLQKEDKKGLLARVFG
jgi:molecular chaperone DnaJ|tara:strand:- start:967 stop:2061 length:1095 start_codon:yes stop_codon:yes gene_type:complete